MFIISLSDGGKIKITNEEALSIPSANPEDIIFFKSCNQGVKKSAIMRFYENNGVDEIEDRHNMKYGRLHDGTKVIRQFGIWFAIDGNLDENGRYMTKLDREYYPEASIDQVATEQEWEELKLLPEKDRIEKMMGIRRAIVKNEGFTKIGEIL